MPQAKLQTGIHKGMMKEGGNTMNKVIIGVLVLFAGLAVGWYARGIAPAPDAQQEEDVQEQVVDTPTPVSQDEISPAATVSGGTGDKGGVIATAAVQYTQNGFSPASLTVKSGTTVVFTNASTGGMWVASAVHPTHQLLPGFDQKQSVTTGGTYQYTFSAVGTWQYHNHVNPQDTAVIVVTQ